MAEVEHTSSDVLDKLILLKVYSFVDAEAVLVTEIPAEVKVSMQFCL